MEKPTEPNVKNREPGGSDGRSPRKRKRKRSENCYVDIISGLPDAILGTIVSLLPTKDGIRTQAISRRWRHLWRSAPLNLEVHTRLCANLSEPASIVSKVLSDHPGPARRFCYRFIHLGGDYAQVDCWLHSRALTNLQDLDVSFVRRSPRPETDHALASSLCRLASTLVVAKISGCDFSKEIVPPSNFPYLKDLTLYYVSLSEEFLNGMLSSCKALENLLLWNIVVTDHLRISSPTLRRIGFSIFGGCKELVIEDAPRLERLLLPFLGKCGESIQLIRAPKVEMLGPLSPGVALFQGTMHTVKALALTSGPRLNTILDTLKCFPCLEKFYIVLQKNPKMDVKDMTLSNPLDSIECLGTHLKEMAILNYQGCEQHVGFAKFFVLTAVVLKKIKFGVPQKYNSEWMAIQLNLLQVENRASRDARFDFKCGLDNAINYSGIHDLSVTDPFDCWFFE